MSQSYEWLDIWVLLGKLSLYIVSLSLDADTVLCGASNCALANLCSHTRYVSSLPHIWYYISTGCLTN